MNTMNTIGYFIGQCVASVLAGVWVFILGLSLVEVLPLNGLALSLHYTCFIGLGLSLIWYGLTALAEILRGAARRDGRGQAPTP